MSIVIRKNHELKWKQRDKNHWTSTSSFQKHPWAFVRHGNGKWFPAYSDKLPVVHTEFATLDEAKAEAKRLDRCLVRLVTDGGMALPEASRVVETDGLRILMGVLKSKLDDVEEQRDTCKLMAKSNGNTLIDLNKKIQDQATLIGSREALIEKQKAAIASLQAEMSKLSEELATTASLHAMAAERFVRVGKQTKGV